ILRACSRTKAILLTMHTEDHYVLEALRAGVRGYVVKTQASADLVRAINEVLRGMVYLSPGISQAVVEAYLSKSEVPPDPLTAREREVLQLVAEGKSTKEIAKLQGSGSRPPDLNGPRSWGKTTSNAPAAPAAMRSAVAWSNPRPAAGYPRRVVPEPLPDLRRVLGHRRRPAHSPHLGMRLAVGRHHPAERCHFPDPHG